MAAIQKVSQDKLIELARQAKASGRWFSAETIKRTTGELRFFHSIRGGVSKHTNGTGLAFDPSSKGLLVVWEASNEAGGKDAYRMVNEDGIRALIIDGVRYEMVAPDKA